MSDGTSHRTMDDLARASGISRPTLSKFFDDPASVRPSTRARIEAALAESDYRPNLFARNLNRKRSNSVGILVPALTDPFYAELVRCLEGEVREAGFWPIVLSSHGEAALELEAVETLLSLKAAGAILAPLGALSDLAALERLARALPTVQVDTALDELAPSVGNDNIRSVAAMVDYLCRSGEAPAYFDIPHVNRNSGERMEAYVAAMKARGLQPLVIPSPEGGWEFERVGEARMSALLDADALPARTLFCANDRLAFGVAASAFARRLRIGRGADCDLRLAAHDDHPLSRYACPAFTTMAQDIAGMARESVALLRRLVAGEAMEPEQVRLPAKLVLRESA